MREFLGDRDRDETTCRSLLVEGSLFEVLLDRIREIFVVTARDAAG